MSWRQARNRHSLTLGADGCSLDVVGRTGVGAARQRRQAGAVVKLCPRYIVRAVAARAAAQLAWALNTQRAVGTRAARRIGGWIKVACMSTA